MYAFDVLHRVENIDLRKQEDSCQTQQLKLFSEKKFELLIRSKSSYKRDKSDDFQLFEKNSSQGRERDVLF